jgi:diguanylate cyclase (GGDEF)-like protein
VPLPHAWLDDVGSSPYADQLSSGFRLLRFANPLEREYRAYVLEHSFDLKRIGLNVGILLWLAFAGLDFAMLPAPEVWWVLGVRLVVLIALLICAGLIPPREHAPLLQPLSLLCISIIGIGAALVVGIAHHGDPNYPYEGLLLVSMAAYFLVGLRLSEALACAWLVLLVYVGVELWVDLPMPRLVNNVLFLLFGNLIGAVGCYLLEFKSREHFLVSQLMRVLAEHDSLTGLHNRRSFNRTFERLGRQAQRDSQSIALLLCDIDHFKAYNDRYGHQAGDSALQRVGSLLNDAGRRPLDMAVRLGGEEFAVLLYGIDETQAWQRGEALRTTLEQLKIPHAGSDTAGVLTMSVGVACIQPAQGGELAQLYEHADRALYEAKAFGRNQVVM